VHVHLLDDPQRQPFAVVLLDGRLPLAPPAPDGLADLVAAVRARTGAAILTLGAESPHEAGGADADLPPDTPVEAVAAGASTLASAVRGLSSTMRRWGPLRLDASTSEVHWGSTPVRLTVHQFRLLDALVAARGATVSADRLARALYGRALQSDLDRIRAHVARLRQRLEAASPTAVEIVLTVRAKGYRVVPPGQSYQGQIDMPAAEGHPPPQVFTRVGHAGQHHAGQHHAGQHHAGQHRGQLPCAADGSVSGVADRYGSGSAATRHGDGWRTA